MAHHRRSEDHADGIRKRIGKACDRCRLKKTRCDGTYPCVRCKADNAICAFGERRKPNRIYPKGYVELLEHQQSQLVAGLQHMYKRLQSAHAWDGARLPESHGQPLTHDILAALNLLENRHDGSGEQEPFEDDFQKLQDRLIAAGASFVEAQDVSGSPEPEHLRHRRSDPGTTTSSGRSTPAPLKRESTSGSVSPQTTYAQPNNLWQNSPSVSPLNFMFQSHRRHLQSFSEPTAHSPLINDPLMYEPEWSIPDMSRSSNRPQYPFPSQTSSNSTSMPLPQSWQQPQTVEPSCLDAATLAALVGSISSNMQSNMQLDNISMDTGFVGTDVDLNTETVPSVRA